MTLGSPDSQEPHKHNVTVTGCLFRIKNSVPDLSLDRYLEQAWILHFNTYSDKCTQQLPLMEMSEAYWDGSLRDDVGLLSGGSMNDLGLKMEGGARLYYSTVPFRDGASGSFFKWTPFNMPQQIDLIDFPLALWLYGLSVNILQPKCDAVCAYCAVTAGF